MDTQGNIYRGEDEIREAERSGKTLVPLSEKQAAELESMNRRERREYAKANGLFKKTRPK